MTNYLDHMRQTEQRILSQSFRMELFLAECDAIEKHKAMFPKRLYEPGRRIDGRQWVAFRKLLRRARKGRWPGKSVAYRAGRWVALPNRALAAPTSGALATN